MPDGGEPQVNAIGYGSSEYNGLNAQTDTFTLKKFDEVLNAQLLKCANKDGMFISGIRIIC